MATERLDVIITEQGGPVVQRTMDDIGRRAVGAQQQVDLLTRAFGALAGVLGGREIIRMIDQYTTMQNRLRLVTTDTQNLVAVQNQLYDVAARTRTSFEATSTLYARTALSVRQMSLSQQELLNFTTAVNQAVQLSGVAAQEARAGIIQFTQGLAKGRLDGDELRSVLEQLPFVADVIAKQLNVTRGELRELGSQGKISARTIVEAFQSMEGELAQLFARVQITFDQAWQIFHDRMQQALGTIAEQIGVPQLLATIADNIGNITTAVLALIPALTVLGARFLLFQSYSLLVSALANPFTTLITVVTTFIAYIGQTDTVMNKWLEQTNKHVTMVDRLVATWEGAKAYFQSAWENFPEWFGNIWGRAMDAALRQFARIADFIPNMIRSVGESTGSTFVKNMFNDIAAQFKTGEEILGDIGARALDRVFDPDTANRAAAKYQEAYNATIMRLAKANGSLGQNPGSGGGGGDNSPEKMDRATKRYIEALRQMNLELERQEVLLTSTAQEQRILQQLWQFEDRLKRPLVGTLRDEVEERLRYLDNLKLEREILDGLTGPREKYIEQLARINALEMRGDIGTQDANILRLQQMREYFSSMPSILGQYLTSITDVRVEQEKLMQAMGDGIITLDVFNAKFAQLGIQNAQLAVANGAESPFTILTASLQEFFGEFNGLAQGMSDTLGTLWSNLGDGLADSIGRALVYADNLKAGLLDVARQGVAQLISSLVKLGLQWVLMSTLGKSLAAATTTSTVAMAGAAATAWAPAAAFASLATVGSNAVAASAALTESVGLAQALSIFGGGGFQTGGYTGDGSPGAAAGIVHHKEFVVNAAATARNRPALEAMNRGARSSNDGGWTGNVVLINETGIPMEASAQYTTAGDVEIITRRMIRQEAPGVIANDLNNPTSQTRKSLSRNTNVQNKRNGNA